MNTSCVNRLDYEKTPPGYRVGRKGFSLCAQDGEHLRIVTRIASSAAEALSAAWTHYKREHDPPGMTEIFGCGGWMGEEIVRGWKFRFGIESDEVFYVDKDEARAAAWAWYDRRDNIADALVIFTMPSSASVRSPFWPRCLTWTDEQVAEVERWLWDSSAKMPAVLDTDGGNTDD